jgi:hypothetical protein
MATPPTLTHIAFAGGLDEGQEDEILDPSKSFLVMQNVRQDKRGGLTKRLGYSTLANTRLTGSARTAGRRLLEYNGLPVVIDGGDFDVYSSAAAKNITYGRASECTYRLMDLPPVIASSVVHDVEYCNGFMAVTYASGLTASTSLVGTPAVAVVSATTGETVVASQQVAGSAGMSVVGSYGGRYFVLFAYVDSTTELLAWYLDTQAPASGWVVIGQVAATTSNAFPAIASYSSGVFVAYGTTAGGSRVTVERYTIAGSQDSTTITAASTPGKISIDCNTGGTLWAAFSQGLSINVIGLSPASLASVTSTAITALTATTGVNNVGICEGSTSGTARVWEFSNTTPRLQMCGLTTVAGAAVAGAAKTVHNVIPSSRSFLQGGRYYMAVAPSPSGPGLNGNAQALCVVVDWTSDTSVYETHLRPVANIEPGLTPSVGMFCKFATVSATKKALGFQIVKRGSATVAGLISGDGSGGCMLAELDFGSRNRWLGAKHGNGLFIGGALTSVFEGRSVREVGFLCRPTTPATSTAAGTLTGTYKYVATYETVDAAGNVIVSGVSSPATETPAAENVTVSVAPYTVTSSAASFYTTNVVFYRTVDGGEPPYYRLASVASTGASSTVSYVDSTTDATLATRSKLYAPNLPGTSGEAQDRRSPPGLVHLASYNGTLVGAKGSSLFYSGQEVYGEATWFAPLFEQPLSGVGDVMGLKVLDGTLFVFREDRIYAVSGDPPTDNGASGGLGVPRLVATDVGCIEANSLVATSLGIFFQSRRGIELLTRSGSTVWVGEAIQRTLASYPVVSSAVLDAANSLVRFTLAATESAGAVSGNGRDLVYDLTLQTWISVDDKIAGFPAQSHFPSQDACMVKVSGTWRYAWLSTGGVVHYELLSSEASCYTDVGNWITMSVETAWFKLAGIQGTQQLNHVLFLSRKSTDSKLSVSLAYNYETSYRTARQWTNTEIATLLSSGWPITQLKHEPHDDAECQSVRVKIEDAIQTSGTTGTGKGSTWLALTLDITPKPGVFDVPGEAA